MKLFGGLSGDPGEDLGCSWRVFWGAWADFGGAKAVFGGAWGWQSRIYSDLRVKRRPWDQVKGCREAPRRHQGGTEDAPGMHQACTKGAPRSELAVETGPRPPQS